jgi:RNA polymerase sigma-70 factor (ECF subfamily)
MLSHGDGIIGRVQRGDHEAFGELVLAHQKVLHALVVALTGENDEAEDLAQTCFVEAFDRLGELRDGDRFTPWLFAIARNKCRDWVRQRSRRPALMGDSSRLRDDGRSGLPTTPEGHAMATARDEAVRAMVRSLPEQYRAVVALRYMGELSYAEIAETLEISTSAVGVRWHRARKMLRERLRQVLDDDGDEGQP